MAIKVKAKQTLMHIGKQAGKQLFIMTVDNYSRLDEEKVFREASTHSGMPVGSLRSGWYAMGEILREWLTEGHCIPIPGVGSMRFGISAKAVENVEDVSAELIKSRKVIFTPSVEVKQALADTAISVTCYDSNGNVLKKEEVSEGAAE